MGKENKTTYIPIPDNEAQRLASVFSYEILDTDEEDELNKLTQLAASLFEMPISLITVLDQKRQWFKSRYGLAEKETPRDISFCQYTIMDNELFEVEDASEDIRFEDNPLVKDEPKIRFYAGTPLLNEDGHNMGSLCVIDQKPRKLTEKQKEALRLLGRQVVIFFELHRKKKKLQNEKQALEADIEKRTKSLNEANRELKRFIYKTSHTLQGPIKTMMGLTSLALKETTEQNVKHYLKLMVATENKLDITLSDLLKVVKIKDYKPVKTKIDITRLCKKVFAKVKKANKKEIDLVVEDYTTRPFECDPLLIETMLEQFFDNSAHFNKHERPCISFSIKENDHNFMLTITDNGIGILKEDDKELFDMFYKSEQSKGSGLGLYIIKNIINLLDGSIEYSSVRNKGTTFNIYIPC